MTAPLAPGTTFASDVPARLDRLPWSGWHLRVVVALGVTWMLDGLEVTLVGAVAPVLAEPGTLRMTDSEIGAAATIYLAGAIAGAVLFGRLTDLFGRKRLFLVTLALYSGATLLTALSWSFGSLALLRALTGAGIGGEYAAVNSAIDELVPARLRGRIDLAINGTYWLGTVVGSTLTLILLDRRILPHAVGWRLVFLLGGVLGTAILLVRNHIPESPRWLLLHGRPREADAVVSGIEAAVTESLSRGVRTGASAPCLPHPGPASQLEAKGRVTLGWVARVLLRRHPRRTLLGMSLMIAQAFAYNGIFFTFALVLVRFYGVSADRVGLYLIPFALGNLLGPVVLGHFFDTVGRRPMIASTYAISGILLCLTGYGMARGWWSAASQTALWCLVFFVLSAAASSAYLTVSELFPVELRGIAIALFYAAGTAAGGVVAPVLFGALVQTGSPSRVFLGYVVGAALMIGAGIVEAILGVEAEGKSLEHLATLER
jgi:MFS family permease